MLVTHIHLRTMCIYVQEPVSQQCLPCSILLQSIWGTTSTIYSSGSTPASTTAAWAHLRALRDTGNTCHGSPDLGEGSSRAHTCTSCPWNAKRRRQDYGCTWMCGDSRGCPTSSGDKQAIRVTHRVHAELWTSGPQLATGTTPPAANITTGLCTELEWEQVPSLDGHHVQYQLKSHKIYTCT